MTYDYMIDAIVPVARNAGEKIMEVYARPAASETKGDGSPVTVDDGNGFRPLQIYLLVPLFAGSNGKSSNPVSQLVKDRKSPASVEVCN